MKHSTTVILLAAVLLITACSPSLIVTASHHADTKVTFSTNMSPLGLSLTRRFLVDTNTTNSERIPLYNREEVRTSLEETGVSIQSLSIPGGDDLVFEGHVANLDQASQGIFSPTETGMTISLSRESVNAIINQLPPETADLLELLMAPVFTGEQLSRSEYLEIISAAYGEKIAKEIATATCTLCINAPTEIASTHVSTTNTSDIQVTRTKKTATVYIPLPLLLTLDETTDIYITWKAN